MRRPSFHRSPRQVGPSQALPETRRRIGRSRIPLRRRVLMARASAAYWVAVLLLALITATVLLRVMDRAASAERRLGPVRRVLVTSAPVRAGQPLTSRNTSREDRPVSQLPQGALDDAPVGASVLGPVARGEVLTRARVQSASMQQPDGTAAIAVPLGQTPLAVQSGDRVDVYATYDPSLVPRGAAATSRVAVRAEVVRAGRTSATVRVPDAEATDLAAAVARATLTVALVR